MNDNLDWKMVAEQMRSDLARAVVNERPRLVINLCICLTLLRCRLSVILPEREGLSSLLGIPKQHMAGIWRECASARIVEFRRVELGWEVLVFPDSRDWAVRWSWTPEGLDRFTEYVDRAPGQAQGDLFPADMTVSQARAEVSAEGSSSQFGNQTPRQVTKKVTSNQKGYQGGLGGRTQTESFGMLEPYRLQAQGLQAFNKTCNLEPVSTEGALVQRCLELFGSERMDSYGGVWRLRAREYSAKLERVLDDTELALREGRVRVHPAAYANDTWGRFK